MRLATDDHNEKYTPIDFSKIKVGVKMLDDAVLSLGQYKRMNSKLGDKKEILQAMNSGDLNKIHTLKPKMQMPYKSIRHPFFLTGLIKDRFAFSITILKAGQQFQYAKYKGTYQNLLPHPL